MKNLDDVTYVYMILRYNKKTKMYRKIKIYYDASSARNYHQHISKTNIYLEKYSYRLERYRLTRVEDNDF